MQKYNPAVVIIAYGMNDMAVNFAPGSFLHHSVLYRVINRFLRYDFVFFLRKHEIYAFIPKTQENYIKMATLLRQKNVRGVFVVVNNLIDWTSFKIHRAGVAAKVDVIDFNPLFTERGEDELMSEEIHPSEKGYALMAETIYSYLRQKGL